TPGIDEMALERAGRESQDLAGRNLVQRRDPLPAASLTDEWPARPGALASARRRLSPPSQPESSPKRRDQPASPGQQPPAGHPRRGEAGTGLRRRNFLRLPVSPCLRLGRARGQLAPQIREKSRIRLVC